MVNLGLEFGDTSLRAQPWPQALFVAFNANLPGRGSMKPPPSVRGTQEVPPCQAAGVAYGKGREEVFYSLI